MREMKRKICDFVPSFFFLLFFFFSFSELLSNQRKVKLLQWPSFGGGHKREITLKNKAKCHSKIEEVSGEKKIFGHFIVNMQLCVD